MRVRGDVLVGVVSFGVVDVRWVMSRCVGRRLVRRCGVSLFVWCVVLFLIELGINKFCGLDGWSFLR